VSPVEPSRRVVLLNFVVFQTAWFACVLGAAHAATGWAWVAAGVTLAVHVAWRGAAARTLLRLATVAALGVLGEFALVGVGALRFPGDDVAGTLLGVPAWIAALWLVFATTFEGCLAWLRPRLGLAALLGLVGSPASYFSAVKLGAVELAGPALPSLAWTGAVWALSLPACLALSARLEPADAARR